MSSSTVPTPVVGNERDRANACIRLSMAKFKNFVVAEPSMTKKAMHQSEITLNAKDQRFIREGCSGQLGNSMLPQLKVSHYKISQQYDPIEVRVSCALEVRMKQGLERVLGT